MLDAISNTFIFLAILLVLVVLATMLMGGKRQPRPRQKIQMPQRAQDSEAASPPAAAPTAKKAPQKKAKAKSSQGDDLQRIKGIGPTLEKKLKSQGITQFAQIAKWTEADRANFSDLLSFKGRIEREEWVQQAQAFVNEA